MGHVWRHSALLLAASAVVWWMGGGRWALAPALLAPIAPILALTSPRLYRRHRALGRWLGRWVAVALAWGLLAPFYFVVFSAGRLILALTGRDPLTRTLDRAAATYWTDHCADSDPDRYQRPY